MIGARLILTSKLWEAVRRIYREVSDLPAADVKRNIDFLRIFPTEMSDSAVFHSHI